jgi:agmatinase
MQERSYGKRLYFGGCPAEAADIVVWGLPWDCTASYRPGSRFGPQALREAFEAVESYSPYFRKDLQDLAIHDAGDLELPFGEAPKAFESIRARLDEIAPPGKKLATIGGEHLLSYPIIEHYHKLYGRQLHVLHVDAHCDMRSEYLGVRLSHATVMNLVEKLVGPENVSHFFIRSGSREEWQALEQHPHGHCLLHPHGSQQIEKIDLGYLAESKLYLSIDIDVFDPSLVAATGVPDCGGILFDDFLKFLNLLEPYRIAAFDLMELAPQQNNDTSAVAAAEILRETLLALEQK